MYTNHQDDPQGMVVITEQVGHLSVVVARWDVKFILLIPWIIPLPTWTLGFWWQRLTNSDKNSYLTCKIMKMSKIWGYFLVNIQIGHQYLYILCLFIKSFHITLLQTSLHQFSTPVTLKSLIIQQNHYLLSINQCRSITLNISYSKQNEQPFALLNILPTKRIFLHCDPSRTL